MQATLTIIRYRRLYIPFALFSMILFRLPLFLNKNISFFKLMGCGRNGSFDKHPDWQQWAILAVHDVKDLPFKKLYGSVIHRWLSILNCETWTIFLEPAEGHGKWDNKTPFGIFSPGNQFEGPVAILTRATIRFSKLKAFWSSVQPVADRVAGSIGFIMSVGIGEVPYIKQATFSVWEDTAAMKQFAYSMNEHTGVIKRTRQEQWYKEELFVRFRPTKTMGTIKGINPLKGKL